MASLKAMALGVPTTTSEPNKPLNDTVPVAAVVASYILSLADNTAEMGARAIAKEPLVVVRL